MKKIISVILLAAILLSSLPLVGCSSETFSICILRGAHDLFPATDYSIFMDEMAAALASHGSVIDVVIDGAPYMVSCSKIKTDGTWYDSQKMKQLGNTNAAQLVSSFNSYKAITPESDLISALILAGNSLKGLEGHHKIKIVDSGLSTTGLCDFYSLNALIETEPDKIVMYLREVNALPDLNGCSVEWMGQAQVCGAQNMTSSYAAKLRAIWNAILSAAGAQVSYNDISLGTNSPKSLPECSVVAIEKDALPIPDLNKPIKLEGVFFKPRTAKFKNKRQAEETVRALVPVINNNNRPITLLGTTATHGDLQSSITLSRKRAETVMELFKKNGATVTIECFGIGYADSSLKKKDTDKNGDLLEGAAAQHNRAVFIFEADSEFAEEIRNIVNSL